MFGTLRLAPDSKTVDFIERTDGRSFSEMGSIVPPHSACIHCRSKKVRCGGQKPVCIRCKTSSTRCVYAPLDGRRRALSGQKRTLERNAIQESTPTSNVPQQTEYDSDSGGPLITVKDRRFPSSSPGSRPMTNRASTSTPIALVSVLPSTAKQHSLGSSSNGAATATSRMNDHNPTTPCLDPRSPRPPPNFHSHEGELHPFDTEMTIGTIEEWAQVAGNGADAFQDVLAPTEFNADAPDLWSIPPPFMEDQRLTPLLEIVSSSSLMTGTGLAAPESLLSESNSIPDNRLVDTAQCSRQCLATTTSFLEEVDSIMHNMIPDNLEAVLSWHKRTSEKCLQMLQCQRCYTSSEQMMLIVMLCDKLIMLIKKLLWHTLDERQFRGAVQMGDYETADPSERIGVLRILSASRLSNMVRLLANIKRNSAIEGKEVHLVVIRNMEQELAKTQGRIKDCLAKSIA